LKWLNAKKGVELTSEKNLLTFKSLKQFSIESNQPRSMDAYTPELYAFNRSKIEIGD